MSQLARNLSAPWLPAKSPCHIKEKAFSMWATRSLRPRHPTSSSRFCIVDKFQLLDPIHNQLKKRTRTPILSYLYRSRNRKILTEIEWDFIELLVLNLREKCLHTFSEPIAFLFSFPLTMPTPWEGLYHHYLRLIWVLESWSVLGIFGEPKFKSKFHLVTSGWSLNRQDSVEERT